MYLWSLWSNIEYGPSGRNILSTKKLAEIINCPGERKKREEAPI